MIGRIRGILIKKTPPQVLVECNGVGYEIEVPMTTFYDLPDEGHEVILLTHFVVREDAQLLFGFLKEIERKAFKNLIKVNGIGAKVALSILSGISIDQFNRAIASQDINSLVKIPGIGKKTAERLVLELKDKFDSNLLLKENINTNINDIMEALESLGYARKDIQSAIKELPQDVEINEGIKLSLKWLSK